MSTPTHYGPVPTGGSSSTARDAQTTGSLSCAVQQPAGLGSYNDRSSTFEEQWKLPASQCTKLNTSGTGFKVFNVEFIVGAPRPNLASSTYFISRFNPPEVPTGYYWRIEQLSFKQLEAGDHAQLDVTYSAQYQNEAQYGSTIVADEDFWSVEWQPFQVSPLAYCKNEGKVPQFESWLPGVDRQPPAGQPSDFSEATYIRECLHKTNLTQKWCSTSPYKWVRGDGIFTLNDHEKLIYQLMANNKHAELHHPVLRHVSTKSFPKPAQRIDFERNVIHPDDYVDVLGNYIDECLDVGELPRGCPYTFYDEDTPITRKWQFLKTGDAMQEFLKGNNVYYRRTEEWTGAREWISYFYENGAAGYAGVEPSEHAWKFQSY